MSNERESLGSRLGFLLLSAGCAIGLGNIWRFPFITGRYGGGVFVLIYLAFLILLGAPVLIMELSMGRSSRRTIAGAYTVLSGGKKTWGFLGKVFFAGNLVLMMFYTVVTGWLLAYTKYYLCNDALILTKEGAGRAFGTLVSSPSEGILYLAVTVILAFIACSSGLRKGVEGSVKWMMMCLFLMLLLLGIKALTLPGAKDGMEFYLLPDPAKIKDLGLMEVLHAALGQAFFTLSLGIGSMEIFGSYVNKDHTLLKESGCIILLDTIVALLAGVIIFPVCFSYNVNVGAGPSLIFVSLPHIFTELLGGRWWGLLFFIFMSLAAMTTVIAVFENLIAFCMEEWKMSRLVGSIVVASAVFLLAIPCVLGFNVWSSFQPFGKGSCVLDLEDFIVSQNLLPLGSLAIMIFCTWNFSWGFERFRVEANTGSGAKLPAHPVLKFWFKYVLPLVMIALFVLEYWTKFGKA